MRIKTGFLWSIILVLLAVFCLLDGSKSSLYLFSGLSLIFFIAKKSVWAAIYAVQVYYISQLETIEGGLFVGLLPMFIGLVLSINNYIKAKSFYVVLSIFILISSVLLLAASSFSLDSKVSMPLTITMLVLSLNAVFLGFYFLSHKKDFKFFILGLVIVGFLFFIQGVLLSYGNAGRFSVHEIIGSGGVSYFATSLILMVLGCYLIESQFGSVMVFHEKGLIRHRSFYIVLVVAVLGVLLSISRSSMAVLFFSVMFLVFYEYRKQFGVLSKKVIVVSPLLLVCFFLVFFLGIDYVNTLTGGRFDRDIASVVSGEDGSFSIRLRIWSEVLQTNNLTTWLFGNGLGSFRLVDGRYYEHSVFIAILFSGGLVLVTLFAAAFIFMLTQSKGRRALYLIFSFFIALTFFAHSNLLDIQFWLSVTLLIVIAFHRDNQRHMSRVES